MFGMETWIEPHSRAYQLYNLKLTPGVCYNTTVVSSHFHWWEIRSRHRIRYVDSAVLINRMLSAHSYWYQSLVRTYLIGLEFFQGFDTSDTFLMNTDEANS